MGLFVYLDNKCRTWQYDIVHLLPSDSFVVFHNQQKVKDLYYFSLSQESPRPE